MVGTQDLNSCFPSQRFFSAYSCLLPIPRCLRMPKVAPQKFPAALIKSGENLFQQDCAFCHGRDAGGGETGPDLTRSKLVAEDVKGEKIGDGRSQRPSGCWHAALQLDGRTD